MSESYDEVMLDKLYTGDYLKSESRIGHEVMNFIQATNGNFYMYLPAGHHKKGGDVLFVRPVDKKTVEVFALAVGLEEINERAANYEGISDPRAIAYVSGSHTFSYEDLFSDDDYRGKKVELEELAIFEAKPENVMFPVKPVFIYSGFKNDGDDYASKYKDEYRSTNADFECVYLEMNESKDNNQLVSRLRRLVDSKRYPEGLHALRELIGNDDLWVQIGSAIERKVETRFPGRDEAEKQTFLEFIQKDNDELAYSNMLARYFRASSQLFAKFASEVLRIDGIKNDVGNLKVERERGHIDIRIEFDGHIIVIENKIESDINGIDKSGSRSQLQDYFERTEAEKGRREAHYFVFAPNYNRLDLASYKGGRHYSIVTYKELHKFFNKHEKEYSQVLQDQSVERRYYRDFLTDLDRQSKLIYERNSDIMRRRLARRAWGTKMR